MSIIQQTQSPGLTRIDATEAIASELTADVDELVAGVHSREILRLVQERGVVVFRELNLSDEQQIAFTRTLSTTTTDFKATKITMDSSENPSAEYIRGAFYWHIDGTMGKVPQFASVMSARRLSETGGNTEFCNTYAAYQALSDEERAQYDDLQVVHMFEASQRYVNPEPSYELLQRWQMFKPNVLPLVWKHRSGRNSLVLGSTASHIEGMGLREGQALLVKLRDWSTQSRFTYSHSWRLGDLVIWDNTGTMHRATPYPLDSDRLMYRTQIDGDEPFA